VLEVLFLNLQQKGYTTPIDLEGIPDQFISHGNTKKLLKI